MHRLILVLTLALGLAGCASLQNAYTIATASVTNPVTPKMLYQAEQGLVAVAEGMLVYKNSCVRKLIDQSCRAVIAQIQTYTRQAKPLLASLRGFVRSNDQINAVAVYNELQDIVAKVNAVRVANGVT